VSDPYASAWAAVEAAVLRESGSLDAAIREAIARGDDPEERTASPIAFSP
jgi:hypothetical protein